jgi:hypothetical protein
MFGPVVPRSLERKNRITGMATKITILLFVGPSHKLGILSEAVTWTT